MPRRSQPHRAEAVSLGLVWIVTDTESKSVRGPLWPGGMRTGRQHGGLEETGKAGSAEKQKGIPHRWWCGPSEALS